jgi:nitrous oxide reductase
MTSRKTEALHELAREQYERQQSATRRQLLRASAVAGAGAISLTAATGSASAQSGTLQATSSGDPLLKIRADQMVLTGRTSDPSSPADGTLWYRSDL